MDRKVEYFSQCSEADEYFAKMYRFLQDIPCEYEEWVKDKRGHLVRSSKTNTTQFNILVLEELGLDIMHCYTDHKDVSQKRVSFLHYFNIYNSFE